MHIHILMTEPSLLLWTLFLTRCSEFTFPTSCLKMVTCSSLAKVFLSTYHPVSSYDPPAGGSTHIHCPLMDLMQESQWWGQYLCGFALFKVLYIILYQLLMSLILPWSYIYLFAFCVIQSSLCEMTLLLFKINQMLRSKWCFVYLLLLKAVW